MDMQITGYANMDEQQLAAIEEIGKPKPITMEVSVTNIQSTDYPQAIYEARLKEIEMREILEQQKSYCRYRVELLYQKKLDNYPAWRARSLARKEVLESTECDDIILYKTEYLKAKARTRLLEDKFRLSLQM